MDIHFSRHRLIHLYQPFEIHSIASQVFSLFDPLVHLVVDLLDVAF
jgi:hypothetical protein